MSEKSDGNNHRRRNILKKTVAAGTIGATGTFGLSQSSIVQGLSSDEAPSHTASNGLSFGEMQDNLITTADGRVLGYEDSEVKIEEPEIAAPGRARREARGAMSSQEVKGIRDWFQQRGLRPDVTNSFALELTYSDNVEDPAYDEDLDDADPVVVAIPYVPTGNKEGEGGLLKVFMIDAGPRRVPGGAVGFHVIENETEQNLSVIGQSDGEAAIIHEESLSGGFTASGYAECMACELAVGGICEGTYGAVGYSGCIFICTGAGPAWLACTPVCAAIVAIGVSTVCYIGADQFCKQEGFC